MALDISNSNLESVPTEPALTGLLSNPRWYAIHTKSRCEKRVADALQKRGILIFLPLLRQLNRWSDRWRTVEFPAFSCYVFAQIEPTPEARVQVLKVPNVFSFVGREPLGTWIPDVEIDSLRTVFQSGVACHAHPFLNVGDRVRIRGGSLHGVEGILAGRNGDQSVVISVELLGRSLSVRVEGYDLEPVWSSARPKLGVPPRQELVQAS